MKRRAPPEMLEPAIYFGLMLAGVAGTALALLMGKLFAAALLGALSLGCFMRFKRGRVAKAKDLG